jgi:uncharacterized protein (DUF488 family)
MATPIMTIGYGNRALDEFIRLLKKESVQFLIDVRSSPYSRFKPEFSGEPLEQALRRAGIRYLFMGDSLGGRPGDESCYEDGHVIYDRVQTREFFQAGIERLRRASDHDFRVCLLCSEVRPGDCHRSKLIGVALARLGVHVVHFGPSDEHLTQAQVISGLESLQGDLFGQQLRSRKTYGRTSRAPHSIRLRTDAND